jgi:DNA-binding MarR family transcriptional regulator
MHVRRAARLLTAYYDEYLAPAGISGTQFTLLNEIYLNSSITIGRLAEMLGVDRTTLNRNLNLLERKKLVSSSTGEDLRMRILSLTPNGQKALKKALPHWQLAQSKVEAILGKQFKRLIGDLRKLEKLKRYHL